jgi:hypothetical protein
MTTALDMMQASLEQIQVYPPGVTIGAADSARALWVLNNMLDNWSNQKLACYANVEQSFVLQPGVNQYSIGVGGTINKTRPLTINTGPGAAYLMDFNNIRYPMDVVEQDQWNLISLLTELSDLPTTLFYDPQYPLGLINVFPQPTMQYTVYFDSRLPLIDLVNNQSTFSLPPGYLEAIQNNLSVRLWRYYKKIPISQGDPDLLMLAKDSLGDIKRTNMRQSPSIYDSAVVSKASSVYNIYTDSSGSPGRG